MWQKRLKMNKKIVFVIPSLGKGGAERSLLNFVSGIEKLENIAITIIVLNKWDHEYNIFSKDVSVVKLGVRRTILPGSWIKLIKCVNKINPDILIGWSFIPNIILTLFRKFIKAKKLYISERDATLHTVRYHTKGVINNLLPRIQKKLYVKADGIILNSQQNLIMYRRFLKKQDSFFYFLPNAIPSSTIYKREPDTNKIFDTTTPFKILIVGRMEYQKGFDLVLDALSKISFKNFILYAIGNGTEFETLKKKAKDLHISDKIEWLGDQVKPGKYYENCDLLIFSSRHEGFPNVLLEGMSYGIPVVTSNCFTGPVEMTENGKLALLFKSESLDDLVLKLKELFGEYSKYYHLAQHAQEVVFRKHNFDAVKYAYQQFVLENY